MSSKYKFNNPDGIQFWQQDNKPIELWSPEVIQQKIDYIHKNPVAAGFVTKPEYWKYSSAINFAGGKGVIEIDELYKRGTSCKLAPARS